MHQYLGNYAVLILIFTNRLNYGYDNSLCDSPRDMTKIKWAHCKKEVKIVLNYTNYLL